MTTPVVPALSRDPYAAAVVLGTRSSRLCQSQKPVVMGPRVRGDDEN
jgi:hypothetical protein